MDPERRSHSQKGEPAADDMDGTELPEDSKPQIDTDETPIGRGMSFQSVKICVHLWLNLKFAQAAKTFLLSAAFRIENHSHTQLCIFIGFSTRLWPTVLRTPNAQPTIPKTSLVQ